MPSNKIFPPLLFIFLLSIPNLYAQDNDQSIIFDSPDGSIEITFGLDDGSPYYSVDRMDSTVIEKSRLDLDLGDGGLQENRFSIIDMSRVRGDRELEQPTGEMQFNRNLYNEMKFHLGEDGPTPREPVVVFRAYNDGIGFRYELANQDHETDYDSLYNWTEFNLSDEH